jgi:hypothetical protein
MEYDSDISEGTHSFYSETESDSSTSTASDYEEKYIEKSDLEKERLKLKGELIIPIKSKPFTRLFSNEIINDNFELVLLRVLHLLFLEDDLINIENLKKFMDLNRKECDEMLQFFSENRGVFIDDEFYYSVAGLSLRTQWFDLLSNKNIFMYKEDKKSIYPDIENYIRFIKYYFPLLKIESSNIQDQLNEIYNQLNFNFKTLEVIYSDYQKIELTTIHKSQIQNIIINGIEIFIWEMFKINEISNNSVEIYSESELRYY